MMFRFPFLASILVLFWGWVTGLTTVSEAKILGIWLFDEGQGNVLKDSSDNGYNGEITGGKWIDGKFGKALEFDANTFIRVKDPKGVFALSKGLTVMTWAYLTALPNQFGGIPRKMDSADAAGWVLHPSAEGGGYKMYFWAFIGAWKGVPSNTTLKFSKDWHHFAATSDGKTLKIYLDGKLDGSQAAPGEIKPGDGDLAFSNDCCGGRKIVGALDECLLSDEVLTEAELQKFMQDGLKEALVVQPQTKLAITWGALKR